jgi:hypothetical protein
LTCIKQRVLDIVAARPQLLGMRPIARILLALALLSGPAPGHAGDLRGARIESLRGDLQAVRARSLQAPRASVYDLTQLRRRLAEQRAATPDDPRLERLELERRHDQWQAERALRQGRGRASQALLEDAPERLATPAYLRAPTDLDLRGSALPIGTGKRFLFVQGGLRDARAALERGERGAAAGHLARAESDFGALQTEASADDPNLVALAAEIAALRQAVGDAGPG